MNLNPKKLHLGCGSKFIPNFYHIDISDEEHIDARADVKDLSFIEDNSVSLIYACHVLEHFGRWEVEKVLIEWRRVLEPSGILRLAVPDFSACSRLYNDGNLENGLCDLLGLLCGGQKDQFDFHKMIFDELTLTSLLEGVGFSSVKHWDWRNTTHTAIDDYSQAYLPHMDKKNGELVSLNLEATK